MNEELHITLIFFFFILGALALFIKSNGGLFLARFPWTSSDYESDNNKRERQAGLAFASFGLKSAAVALPLLLILYNSLITRSVGVLLIISITLYIAKSNLH